MLSYNSQHARTLHLLPFDVTLPGGSLRSATLLRRTGYAHTPEGKLQAMSSHWGSSSEARDRYLSGPPPGSRLPRLDIRSRSRW